MTLEGGFYINKIKTCMKRIYEQQLFIYTCAEKEVFFVKSFVQNFIKNFKKSRTFFL